MVEIRSRDQVWQLLLVGAATSALLLVVGIVVLTRGGDDTTDAGLGSDADTLGAEVIASPSGGAEGEDGSQRRPDRR